MSKRNKDFDEMRETIPNKKEEKEIETLVEKKESENIIHLVNARGQEGPMLTEFKASDGRIYNGTELQQLIRDGKNVVMFYNGIEVPVASNDVGITANLNGTEMLGRLPTF